MDEAIGFLIDFLDLGTVTNRVAEGLIIVGLLLSLGDIFFELPELEGKAGFIGLLIAALGVLTLIRRDKPFSLKRAFLSKSPA